MQQLPFKISKKIHLLFLLWSYWKGRKKYKNKDKPIVKLETAKGQSHCIPSGNKNNIFVSPWKGCHQQARNVKEFLEDTQQMDLDG